MQDNRVNNLGPSSLSKLMIRGVRSFDPNHDEAIEFYSPLTMIVGANGCGKTTIIESLKFACTGMMPPGANKGQSFVNDPGMTDSTEVKASIKLRFNSASNDVCVLQRSMQLTKKKVKLEFKQLDGTIKQKDHDGNQTSLSYKCADLDKYVPQLLNVSPAILESVIFCHQEESSWPMLEGAVLKKKFDEILESSRYTKALDALSKTKKVFQSNAKDFKAEMMQQAVYLENAKELKQELEETERETEESTRDVDGLQEQVDALDDRMDRDKEELERIQKRFSQVTELQREADEELRRINDRKEGLEREYTESDFELNRLLDNFEGVMREKQSEMQSIKREIDGATQEVALCRERSDDLMIKKGTAESLATHFDSLLLKFDQQAQGISTRFDVPFAGSALVPSQGNTAPSQGSVRLPGGSGQNNLYDHVTGEAFWATLNHKISAMQSDMDSRLGEKKRRLDQASSRVASLRDQQNRHEVDLDAKSKAIERTVNELDEAQTEIRALGSLKSRIATAERDSAEKKAHFADFTEPRAVGSQAGSLPGLFSQASQVLPSPANPNQSPPGYDDAGNFLGYSRLREHIAARVAAAKARIATLADDYDRDAAHLLQLSTKRKEIDMRQAALAQVQADIEDERSKLASQWTRSRPVLTRYLDTDASSSSSSSSSSSAGEDFLVLPSSVSELEGVMGRLDTALYRVKSGHEAAARALADTSQELGSGEAVLHQAKGTVARLEADLRVAKQSTSAGAMDPAGQFHGVTVEFGKILAEHGSSSENDLLGAYNSKGERRPPERFDMPNVSTAMRVLEDAKAAVAQRKDALVVVERVEQAIAAKSEENTHCFACGNQTTRESRQRIEACKKEVLATDTYRRWGSKDDLKNLMKRLATLLGQLRDLEHPMRDIDRLNAELAASKAEVDSREKGVAALRGRKEKRATEAAEAEEKYTDLDRVIKRLKEVLVQWNSKHAALTDRQRDLDLVSSSSASGGKSMDDLEGLQASRLKDKEAAQKEKDGLTEYEKDLERRYFALKEAASDADNKLLAMRQQANRLTTLEESVGVLKHRKDELDQGYRTVKVAKTEVQRDLAELGSEHAQLRLDLESEEGLLKAGLEDIRGARDQFRSTQEGVVEMSEKLAALDFQRIATDLDSVQTRIAKGEEAVRTLTPKMQSLSAEISQQDRTRRCVKDNVDIRASEKTREGLLKKIKETKQKLGFAEGEGEDNAMDVASGGESAKDKEDKLERALQKAEQSKSKLIQELYKAKGRVETLMEKSAGVAEKLSSTNLVDIETRYRKVAIQFETTEMAVKDLEAYYSALDKALQNYHTKSIHEINKIIRELWQLIYKGQDIEMIELESGAEGTSSAATRSYNYRVVMRKGDHPLDMRGRCSAGQRVLAAIVIRLALAETFCLDCGILALDEPTTNLDDANKAGLATALARIIVQRSQQHNFQLICITHDEDFVKLMSMELAANSDFSLPEYYFRVSREEDEENAGRYFSHIDRILWSDM